MGHTEQLLSVKCQAGKYVVANSDIRDHVSRLNINLMAAQNPDADEAEGKKYKKTQFPATILTIHLFIVEDF